ncbi:uncharacterized protein [Antedon mediterranea]|uniref:uncharacterized protein n=1 Tax=Antedon mediterranea TaxID=105859 RepID=UPI003AF9998D
MFWLTGMVLIRTTFLHFIAFYFVASFIEIIVEVKAKCEGCEEGDESCCSNNNASNQWYFWVVFTFLGLMLIIVCVSAYRFHAEKRSGRVLSVNIPNRMHENRRFPPPLDPGGSDAFRPPNSPPPSYWDVLQEVRRDIIISMSPSETTNSQRFDTEDLSGTRIRRQNTCPARPIVFTLPGAPIQDAET